MYVGHTLSLADVTNRTVCASILLRLKKVSFLGLEYGSLVYLAGAGGFIVGSEGGRGYITRLTPAQTKDQQLSFSFKCHR